MGTVVKNKLIIFSPSEIEIWTNHKKSEFVPLISHETTHIFQDGINPDDYCYWLSEGVAQVIANQVRNEKIIPQNIRHFFRYSLFKNTSYGKFVSKQGYEISYKLSKYLIDNYSQKQIMELLKLKYDDKTSSEKVFCKILEEDKGSIILKFKKVLL